MRAYIALLGLLALLSIAILPAVAVKFSIYAYDKESNTLIQNAIVKVWQNNNLLNGGNTDKNGCFVAYLIDGNRYHIRAEYYNKFDDFPDYLADSAKSARIDLNLHI